MVLEAKYASPLRLSPRVRFRQVGSEGVVVQIERGEIVVVNEVGLRTLDLLRDGVTTVPEIASRLESEYAASTEQLLQDVAAYVDQLAQQGIVTAGPA